MIAATSKNVASKVKAHVQENKKYYIIGGVVVVGIAIGTSGYILGTKTSPKEVENLITPKINQVLSWKPEATLEVYIEALGDPGNIIQDTTTGTIYASQGQAARELGVYPSRISEHLAGKIPNVQGHVLKNLGKAAVAE
ncbi:HNH endonuclease [Gordonia phage Pherobrine]|nr:HNH endonuclease [Gordonia phage Pherobrine]